LEAADAPSSASVASSWDEQGVVFFTQLYWLFLKGEVSPSHIIAMRLPSVALPRGEAEACVGPQKEVLFGVSQMTARGELECHGNPDMGTRKQKSDSSKPQMVGGWARKRSYLISKVKAVDRDNNVGANKKQ
jgi:hypothetical protein